MIDSDFLQKKILAEIPILAAMKIKIEKVEKNFSLISAPLQENHNHKGTAFGGSLYAACTAACYCLIYSRQLQSQIEDRDLVITTGNMRYLKPVKKDFHVKAELDEEKWKSLLESLKNKRPEKLAMKAFILNEKQDIACEFNAEFALLPSHLTSK